MKIGKIEDVELLFALLPGLLTYLVVYFLASRQEKIDAIKAVLLALAFTLVSHATWSLLKSLGSYIPTPDIVGITITATAWGVIFGFLVNRGWIYRLLRSVGISAEPGAATIWR